jgi:hypothetical protein
MSFQVWAFPSEAGLGAPTPPHNSPTIASVGIVVALSARPPANLYQP